MQSIYYSAIGIIAIIIHIILNLGHINNRNGKPEDKAYKRYLISIFIYYCIDALWGIIDFVGNEQLLYIDTILYYVALAFTVTFGCRYVIAYLKLTNLPGKILGTLSWIFGIGVIPAMAINYFSPLFFSFDNTGSYSTHVLRYAFIILQILMYASISLMSFVHVIRSKDGHDRRNRAICYFGLIMTTALVLQTLFTLHPFYAVGLMIGTLIINIFIIQEDQVKQYNEIKQLNTELEAVSRSKTIFLNNMSHDIRTPMNAILGYTQLIKNRMDDPDVMSNYLKKIESSGEYLLNLINNVLDMARIESGKAELNEDFYDLTDETTSIVPLFEANIRQKKQKFSASIDVKHKYVLLDKVKVHEIMANLISNAIKYTPQEGSITIHFKELPCPREGFGRYEFMISDTGIGMSKDFAAKVFDMFSRERTTTESKVQGTGLGMSIVKKLVDLMKGQITVETEVGQGTTIRLVLEHKIVPNPEDYINKQLKNSQNSISFDNKRILLAEDNELNAEIATVLLEEAGLKIEHAEDGVQCIKMLTEADADHYDAILMDIQMPNLNGYDTTKTIRNMTDKKKANIPIIAMTANVFEEDKNRAREAGMNGHLCKPIEIPVLMETLAEIFS